MVSHWTSVCLSSIRLSVSCTSIHLYFISDDNLSKCQWIFTKLGMCINIVEIWFGIANGQISSNFNGVFFLRHTQFSCPDDNLSKHQWIFTKLGVCIDVVEIWFGIANG